MHCVYQQEWTCIHFECHEHMAAVSEPDGGRVDASDMVFCVSS